MTHKTSHSALILVPEALSDASDLPEILWYFSHFSDEKRIFLAQNPHFYENLPISQVGYMGEFNRQPIEIYKGTIDVLTNNERRVFFECGQQPRIFDNIWDVNGILIFKSLCVIFLFSPKLTSFQTLRESWKAKRSSDNTSQISPSSSLV